MRSLALALVFCLPALALAVDPAPDPKPVAPRIKLPPDPIQTKAGELGKLRCDTTGKCVRWVALTPGLSLDPIDNGRVLYYTGLPGRYTLLCYTAAGDVPSDPARCVIVIGDAPAPGPGPQPGPGPGPAPPADPLKARLKAAYDTDPLVIDKRREQAKDLAALYRQAAKLAADPTVATSGDLLQRVKAAAGTLVGADSLKAVRTVAGVELAAVLPTDAALADDQRSAAAALFAKLAATLDELAR